MNIDATFWVAIYFFICLGIIIYLKVTQKINSSLVNQINKIKKELDEAERLKVESKNLLSDCENKIDKSVKETKKIMYQAKSDCEKIILDKSLNTNISSYIFKTVKKNNTIIFYNKGSHKKINAFIKKGVILVKHELTKNDSFDLRSILKKLYYLNCRNLLVEGGKNLSIDFFNNKLFNQFYLFKSDRIIQKIYDYKEFNPLNYLSKNYKYRSRINTFLGEDTIYLYTN